MDSRISIEQANIVDLDVDAIVNAANSRLLMGGGVCGAIYKSASQEKLARACSEIGGCRTGSAAITSGFNLKAEYIIHAVGPKWRGGGENEEELLYNAYQESLRLAMEHDCRSITFPVISSVIYGYPKREAWEVAIRSCNDFIRDNPDYNLNFPVV